MKVTIVMMMLVMLVMLRLWLPMMAMAVMVMMAVLFIIVSRGVFNVGYHVLPMRCSVWFQSDRLMEFFCVSPRVAAIVAVAFGHLFLEAGALPDPWLCSVAATEEAWDCGVYLHPPPCSSRGKRYWRVQALAELEWPMWMAFSRWCGYVG